MELKQAMLAPVAVGAIMYIVDMLLPESRLSKVALAVAGIVAAHALITPVLCWLSGADASEGARLSADSVLTGQAAQDEPDACAPRSDGGAD